MLLMWCVDLVFKPFSSSPSFQIIEIDGWRCKEVESRNTKIKYLIKSRNEKCLPDSIPICDQWNNHQLTVAQIDYINMIFQLQFDPYLFLFLTYQPQIRWFASFSRQSYLFNKKKKKNGRLKQTKCCWASSFFLYRNNEKYNEIGLI